MTNKYVPQAANDAQMSTICCQNLQKRFHDGIIHVDVLRGVNMKIHVGERVAIVGKSGSGKTTLLHLLGGLDEPSAGSVMINGMDIAGFTDKKRTAIRNQQLGFVYQFHHLLPEFNALENVAMPLLVRGTKVKFAKEKAEAILARVGLEKRLEHKPSELSGGERQRAAIARALVTDPVCVLADEPTGNLDQRTAETIYEIIIALNQELKTSFVVATHDMCLAKQMHRILTLTDGAIST